MAAAVLGQVWTYRTRPGEEQSRVQVFVVEDVPSVGEVVHVSVDGVRIPSSVHIDSPTVLTEALAFPPFHSTTRSTSASQPARGRYQRRTRGSVEVDSESLSPHTPRVR